MVSWLFLIFDLVGHVATKKLQDFKNTGSFWVYVSQTDYKGHPAVKILPFLVVEDTLPRNILFSCKWRQLLLKEGAILGKARYFSR